MKVSDFFNYNHFCPICNRCLTREAEVDVMVDKVAPDDFILAGAVYYNFNGTRFIRNDDKLSHTKKYKQMMMAVSEKFPKTFTLNTRFTPRINKSKLSDMINPWFVNTFDARFYRTCNTSDHTYYYTSKYIIEGELADQVDIDYEMMNIHKFRIYNIFADGILSRTEIADTLDNRDIEFPAHNTKGLSKAVLGYGGYGHLHSHVTLPPIPISKWALKSHDSIKNQLEKYILLK